MMLFSRNCGGMNATTLHRPLHAAPGPSQVITHAILPLVFTFLRSDLATDFNFSHFTHCPSVFVRRHDEIIPLAHRTFNSGFHRWTSQRASATNQGQFASTLAMPCCIITRGDCVPRLTLKWNYKNRVLSLRHGKLSARDCRQSRCAASEKCVAIRANAICSVA